MHKTFIFDWLILKIPGTPGPSVAKQMVYFSGYLFFSETELTFSLILHRHNFV